MLTLDEAQEKHWREFGVYLQRLITDAGLSVSQFADKADMTIQQASRILNGKSGTRRTTLPRIIQALGAIDNRVAESIYKKAGFAAPIEITSSHEIRIREAQPPHAEEIPVDQFPEDFQRVVGLYGRVEKRMPPGPAREAYMRKLEATALSDWEMLMAKLDEEEGPEEPRRSKR